MAEYKIKKGLSYDSVITEDGHTMFIEDVLYKLKRLEYLEKYKAEIDKRIKA